jgi:hypothetical protein
MGNKMKNMALELEREMGVFFNISEDSNFSKYFWLIITAE